MLFLIALFAIIWFFRQPKKIRKEVLAFAIISLPIIYIAAKIGSLLYFAPRPFVIENFTPLIPHAADNGFPSDHTLLAGAIASIIFLYNKKIGAVLFMLAFLVGISRVLVGVHHFTDIAGSIVISGMFVYIVKEFVLPIVLKSKAHKKYFT